MQNQKVERRWAFTAGLRQFEHLFPFFPFHPNHPLEARFYPGETIPLNGNPYHIESHHPEPTR